MDYRFVLFLTIKLGLCLTSSYIRAKYSLITPRTKNKIPNRNNKSNITVAIPGASRPLTINITI